LYNTGRISQVRWLLQQSQFLHALLESAWLMEHYEKHPRGEAER